MCDAGTGDDDVATASTARWNRPTLMLERDHEKLQPLIGGAANSQRRSCNDGDRWVAGMLEPGYGDAGTSGSFCCYRR